MSVIIKSKRAGFRRCGIAHSAEPVEYSDSRFSDEDLTILEAEPMLIVEYKATAVQDLMGFLGPTASSTHKVIDAYAKELLNEYPKLAEFIGKGNSDGWTKAKKIDLIESVSSAKDSDDGKDPEENQAAKGDADKTEE